MIKKTTRTKIGVPFALTVESSCAATSVRKYSIKIVTYLPSVLCPTKVKVGNVYCAWTSKIWLTMQRTHRKHPANWVDLNCKSCSAFVSNCTVSMSRVYSFANRNRLPIQPIMKLFASEYARIFFLTYYSTILSPIMSFSPMSLDVIRSRLDPTSPNHYKDIAGFVSDVRLIFKNTYLFYQVSTTTFSALIVSILSSLFANY